MENPWATFESEENAPKFHDLDKAHAEAFNNGIEIHRLSYSDIRELLSSYPDAKAFFNCSGLGSYHLKGVEDKLLYPTRVCPPLRSPIEVLC